MDTIDVNMENLSEDERKQLLMLIEKANNPKRFCFENMKKQDKFYTVNMFGEVGKCYFGVFGFDDQIFSQGNAFSTRKDAEFEVERRKLVQELKEFIAENDPVELDWESYEQQKFSLFINIPGNELGVETSWSNCGRQKGLFASSEEILKEAIEEIGENRIKKYLFA